MTKINQINISKTTLKLIKNMANKTPSEIEIIALVNQLRNDNNMPILKNSNFDFHTVQEQAGQWNESTQQFQLSLNALKTYDILSTIFHEFRHCWQYFNRENLNELTQYNLNGYYNDKNELYFNQPIEMDAYKFEHDIMYFLSQELNLPEYASTAEYKYNNIVNCQKDELYAFKTKKYKLNEEFYKTLYKFRANRLCHDEQNPEFRFHTGHYDITFSIDNNNLYYLISDENSFYTDEYENTVYTSISASCKNGICYINDFILQESSLNQDLFNSLLEINEKIVKFYNENFDTNITNLKITPFFSGMTKNEHNLLISRSKYETKLIHFTDPYFENPFNLILNNNSTIENDFLNAINNQDITSIINKVKNNKDLSNLEFDILRKRYENISIQIDGQEYKFTNLSNNSILNIFKKQIKQFNEMKNVLNDKNIKVTMNEIIRFANEKNIDDKLSKLKLESKEKIKENIKEKDNQNLDDLSK